MAMQHAPATLVAMRVQRPHGKRFTCTADSQPNQRPPTPFLSMSDATRGKGCRRGLHVTNCQVTHARWNQLLFDIAQIKLQLKTAIT
eukprot:scaffold144514_cov19-Tisochrysis_lutea.AAC.2